MPFRSARRRSRASETRALPSRLPFSGRIAAYPRGGLSLRAALRPTPGSRPGNPGPRSGVRPLAGRRCRASAGAGRAGFPPPRPGSFQLRARWTVGRHWCMARLGRRTVLSIKNTHRYAGNDAHSIPFPANGFTGPGISAKMQAQCVAGRGVRQG